jgi:hypothetical protein
MRPANSHAVWPAVVATALMLLLAARGGANADDPAAPEGAPRGGIADATAADAGSYQSLALADDGSAGVGGGNGRIGDGSTRSGATPAHLPDVVRMPQ